MVHLRGRVVRTLEVKSSDRGRANCFWDDRDARGTQAASGVYFAEAVGAEVARGAPNACHGVCKGGLRRQHTPRRYLARLMRDASGRPGSSMTTTPMAEADAAEVSELLRSSYRLLGDRERLSAEQTHFLVSQRGSLECVRRESQSQRYLVARDARGIVGMVAVSGDTITKLYVSPEHTGEGIGRSLYEAAESSIRAEGHTRVTLGAFPTAVPFYTRMGLSVVGHKEATGALEGLTVALMQKELGHRAA